MAMGALVRLLARVDPLVHFLVAFMSKPVLAKRALVFLDALVDGIYVWLRG